VKYGSGRKRKAARPGRVAESYAHYEAQSPMRPDVGTQPQFRKRKPPATYRYDSSLSPALNWDGQNPGRELGEWLLSVIERAAALPAPHAFDRAQEFKTADGTVVAAVTTLHEAVGLLRRLGRPFLDWTGKAVRLSFDVPTLPLFIHERLSTKAIVQTLTGHRRDRQQTMFELFGDPQHPVADQILRAYEYPDKWVNRLVLGDSLVVMNSLLHYEGLGGQVQMIYMDPPYGVKFGSNFQPFVRRRDVSHNDDADMTREPEMVKAYRDTWELGLHSYLTYMRDRLLLCRELLAPSGSIFVQIGDENLHHARELMDEVFGSKNFVSFITFAKTSGSTGDYLPGTADYLLFYARDRERLRERYSQPFVLKEVEREPEGPYQWIELPDGSRRRMSREERKDPTKIPAAARIFRLDNLQSQSVGGQKGEGAASRFPVEFQGREWRPSLRARWKTNEEGMARLKAARRFEATEGGLYYVRYIDDFPAKPVGNNWQDTTIAGFASDKAYAVETSSKVIQRCMLMTTRPGDLVLDPTCGGGTTAYVAERWGRRWITVDVSRVPLALARQRLLTATFPYYRLLEDERGPAGGFVYVRRQNRRGEEVGGIVPHVQLEEIAKGESPSEEVMPERPAEDESIVRVTGPFTVEATIPTPIDWDSDGVADNGEEGAQAYSSFLDRMLEILRRSPVLHVGGGKTVTLRNVRPPARTLSLSAEAVVVNGDERPVALLFGPENGGVTQRAVHEALKEASLKGYAHLYVVGFAIQADARLLIEKAADMGLPPASYVQATPDLMMGDLLKNMRSSQIFSVCGLPDLDIRKRPDGQYEVTLAKLNVFDPPR